MKAVRYSYHKSSIILHCSGAEETLISCLLPDTSMSTCYYLLVECRDRPDFTEYITQTPVIITTNTPLSNSSKLKYHNSPSASPLSVVSTSTCTVSVRGPHTVTHSWAVSFSVTFVKLELNGLYSLAFKTTTCGSA